MLGGGGYGRPEMFVSLFVVLVMSASHPFSDNVCATHPFSGLVLKMLVPSPHQQSPFSRLASQSLAPSSLLHLPE